MADQTVSKAIKAKAKTKSRPAEASTTATAAEPKVKSPRRVSASKPTPERSEKPVRKSPAKSPHPSKLVVVEKVRDRFSMPPADYALIAALKLRAGDAGRKTKKNELLRAGLQALNELDALSLVDALNRLSR